MRDFLKRRWFMLLLLLFIPLGMTLGYRADPERTASFPKHLVSWASGGLTALVLFLMSVTLPGNKLIQAFRSPGPVMWAVAINYLVIPLLALPILGFQGSEDLAVGLMVAAAVPSTLAAASVWTRKADGNDAVPLLVTMITNGTCFIITPLWLQFACGSSVELDTAGLMTKLFFSALVPISLGQFMRFFSSMRTWADRGKTGFGVIAQLCILAIVFWASVQGGVKLNPDQPDAGMFRAWPLLVAGASCITLHLTAALITFLGGVQMRFPREDVVGAVFAASQKTLPIGIFIAAEMAARGLPFAVLPVLIYHASQLIIDTFLVDPLRNWISAQPSDATPEPATSAEA